MWVMMGIYGTWSYMVTWYPMIRWPISSIPGAISQIVNNSLYTLHADNLNNVCGDFPLGVCPRLHKPLFPLQIPLTCQMVWPKCQRCLSYAEPATTPFLNPNPFKPGSLQNHLIKMWEQGSYKWTILRTISRGAYQALFIPYLPFWGNTKYNELSFTLKMTSWNAPENWTPTRCRVYFLPVEPIYLT